MVGVIFEWSLSLLENGQLFHPLKNVLVLTFNKLFSQYPFTRLRLGIQFIPFLGILEENVLLLVSSFLPYVLPIFPWFYHLLIFICGPGSSFGIATELRAGRSGIESRWGQDFPPVHTGPGAHPASCKMGTGSFLRVKCGRGVLLTTHPFLVPRSWKSRAILLPTIWATPSL